MIFSTGPAPDAKFIEDRPDDVSAEAAVGAWMAGYYDARNGREYHVFPPDSADLQPFYSNGFERGERDELHMQRINGRLPEKPAEGEAKRRELPPAPIDRALARAKAYLSSQAPARHLKLVTDLAWLAVLTLVLILLVGAVL